MVITYSVILYRAFTYTSTSDLTNDVLSIPIFTDTGDGEINTATIRLSAKDNKYAKPDTDQLDDHDRIWLSVFDGSQTYNRAFEIMSRVFLKNKIEPKTMQIELAGIEIALTRVKVSMNTFGMKTRDMLTKLKQCYDGNKTNYMPSLTIDVTQIPDIISNLDWSTEDTILNRLNELVDSFGASGDNNGVLDFYDVRFRTLPTNITVEIFSSGRGTDNPQTYETITSNIEFTSKTDPPVATQIASWGATDAGSLPVEWSKFQSRQLIMPTNKGSESNFPTWVSGFPYPINSKVSIDATLVTAGHADKVYRKKTNNITTNLSSTPQSNTTDWAEYTTAEYYGENFTYSPWTSNKVGVWKNNGAGFSNSPFNGMTPSTNSTGLCFFDQNLIINDSSTESPAFRTFVDLKTTSSVINTTWLYGGTSSGIYDGLRVLVDGVGTGAFVGKNNKIMEYKDNSSYVGWIVKYEPKTDMQVVVMDSARVFKYNGSSWVDQSTITGNALDCLHPYDNLARDTSVIINPDTTTTLPLASRQYTTVNNNSALTVTYSWISAASWFNSLTDVLTDSISSNVNTRKNYYSSGAWLCMRFPFPTNRNNGISENVGELMGGTLSSKVPSLDFENTTFTHSGLIGYNESDSEDLGQISSIDFFCKIAYVIAAGGNPHTSASATPFAEGNFPMTMFMIDKNDHVVVQDFVLSFNNTWQYISLPINGFSLYRGRRPKVLSALGNLIPPKDLSYTANFDSWQVKMIGISTKDSYDNYGRFAPASNMFGGGNTLQKKTLQLSIDGLHFVKPLLSITSKVEPTSLTPLKQTIFLQRPTIGNKEQLDGDAYSELLKQSFPYEEYNITTNGKFETKYGNYFKFIDGSIDHTDAGVPNQVLLVAKNIEYSITKPTNNIGGLVRKIRGIRRFT